MNTNILPIVLFTAGGTLIMQALISLVLVYRVATLLTETSCRQMTGVFGFPGLAFLLGGLLTIVPFGPWWGLLIPVLVVVFAVAIFSLLACIPELKRRQKKPASASATKLA